MTISSPLPFDSLPNTRDLGGIATKDGRRIKKGLLYRSGQLYKPTKDDVRKLEALGLQTVYDFRTDTERTEKPDFVLPKVEYIHLPILSEGTLGLSREKGSDKALMKEFMENPEAGRNLMIQNYLLFARDERAIQGYDQFLHSLLKKAKEQDGSFLWHCTAGKDRAGFATVLLMEVLGVDRETIYEDYLSTNLYMKGETSIILDKIPLFLRILLPKKAKERILEIAEELTQVERSYLEATYHQIEEDYGSMEEFFHRALHVTDEEKHDFCRLFLQ